MKTPESLSQQEIEKLCLAYMDCQLSLLQEKELELVLMDSDLTSPIIAETRALMALSSQMAQSYVASTGKPKITQRFFQWASVAVSVALVAFCSTFYITTTLTRENPEEIHAFVDGKYLAGSDAFAIVKNTEDETMRMYKSILKDTKTEQRLCDQYINSIVK